MARIAGALPIVALAVSAAAFAVALRLVGDRADVRAAWAVALGAALVKAAIGAARAGRTP